MCLNLSELQTRIEQEKEIHPSEITDTWTTWDTEKRFDIIDKPTKMVPVEDIIGTAPQNTDRLVKRRWVKIIDKIIKGEWEPRKDPVGLRKQPDGNIYVDSDGNHRVLAHKLLDIDVIYAELKIYETRRT